MAEDVRAYTERYVRETRACLEAPYLAEGLQRIVTILAQARNDGRWIFFFGNGGSASTGSHMACDIGKSTIVGSARRMRCLSLSDQVPTLLAWANDVSYAEVFAEQLKSLGSRGDVAVGISGSGNSPNVLRALEEARKMGMTTVGLIGMGGGKMRALCDVAVVVPSNNMQHIEDTHLLIGHLLTSYLRDEMAH